MTPVVYGTVDAPQIERVVVTSSYTAVDTFDNQAGLSTTSTEKLWIPITWEQLLLVMLVPKKLCWKSCLGFCCKRKTTVFTLCVVNSVYVFVPHAFDIKNYYWAFASGMHRHIC